MADQNDIFNADPVNDDVTADILIGDGKKYKDVNDLAKAYVNADTHIMELRRDLVAVQAERDLLKANNDGRPNDNPGEGEPKPDQLKNDPNNPAPKVNEEDFRDTLRREVEALDQEKRAASNAEAAAQKLVEHFGDAAKANEAVRRRAQELNVSTEWLRDAAARSPEAFYASMGITNQSPGNRQTPTPRNDMVPNRQDLKGAKKYSDFEELRKTNKSLYYSVETQREMQALAKEQGNAFYS